MELWRLNWNGKAHYRLIEDPRVLTTYEQRYVDEHRVAWRFSIPADFEEQLRKLQKSPESTDNPITLAKSLAKVSGLEVA